MIRRGKDKYVFNEHIDERLVEDGFYYNTMSPRFMQKAYDDIIKHDKWCLRRDYINIDKDLTLRVFINSTELFIEVQECRWFASNVHEKLEFVENPKCLLGLDCNDIYETSDCIKCKHNEYDSEEMCEYSREELSYENICNKIDKLLRRLYVNCEHCGEMDWE